MKSLFNECFFLQSPEGSGFNGAVTVVGDAVGSILLYDALCKEQDSPSRFGSENSIAEDTEEHHEESDNHYYGASRLSRSGHLQAPPRRHSSCSRSVYFVSQLFWLRY